MENEIVICDYCDKDFTNSDEKGGFLFGSYAGCKKCYDEMLPRIRSYGEEKFIKDICPPSMSFREFVITRCR